MSGFTCASNRTLRRAGLLGASARVMIGADALHLAGDTGGTLRIPYDMIGQLRVERIEGKGFSVFSAYITRLTCGTVVRLLPLRDQSRPYAATVRALAGELARRGAPERLLCGDSKAAALTMLVAAAAAVPCAGAFVVIYGNSSPWWEPASLLAAAAMLSAFFCWVALARSWPRIVTDSATLERYLPC